MPEGGPVMRVRASPIGIAGWLLGMAPALAIADVAPVRLCANQLATPYADGRVLGHLPYAQVAAGELAAAPAGFAIGGPCVLHRDAVGDLARLLDAAAGVPGIGRRLRGVSCFRTVEHQRWVFCSRIGVDSRYPDAAARARFVGPPGYSEHATGYALDFGIRPSPGCADVDSCIAATPAGQWLLAHAPEYGFELSFPNGNAQGVAWEPWHWRWIGTSPDETGAAAARLLFATARARFAASPAVGAGPAPLVDQLPPVPQVPPPQAP